MNYLKGSSARKVVDYRLVYIKRESKQIRLKYTIHSIFFMKFFFWNLIDITKFGSDTSLIYACSPNTSEEVKKKYPSLQATTIICLPAKDTHQAINIYSSQTKRIYARNVIIKI